MVHLDISFKLWALTSINKIKCWFLKVLMFTGGILNLFPSKISYPIYQETPNLDFSHLTKGCSVFHNVAEAQSSSFVLEYQQLSEEELIRLKKEGVTTIIGFNLDSKRLKKFQENNLNFLFIPIQDYSNIALRKFSQLLQMKVDQKVIFQPQEIVNWISAEDLTI